MSPIGAGLQGERPHPKGRQGPLRRKRPYFEPYFGWKNDTGVISWLFCDSR